MKTELKIFIRREDVTEDHFNIFIDDQLVGSLPRNLLPSLKNMKVGDSVIGIVELKDSKIEDAAAMEICKVFDRLPNVDDINPAINAQTIERVKP